MRSSTAATARSSQPVSADSTELKCWDCACQMGREDVSVVLDPDSITAQPSADLCIRCLHAQQMTSSSCCIRTTWSVMVSVSKMQQQQLKPSPRAATAAVKVPDTQPAVHQTPAATAAAALLAKVETSYQHLQQQLQARKWTRSSYMSLKRGHIF